MRKSKIFTLLQRLNIAERRLFRKFLCSPYHNEQELLVQWYDTLLLYVSDQEAELSKVALWRKAFGSSLFDDQAFRRMNNELLQLLLSFLAQEELRRRPAAAKLAEMQVLNQPQLNKHFDGVVRQYEALPHEETPAAFNRHFEFWQLRHQHTERLKHRSGNFEYLEKSDRNLDLFFLAQKLKNYSEALGYAKSRSVAPQLLLPPDFMERVAKGPYIEQPFVKAYFLVANMLLDPEQETFFQQLRQLLDEKASLFPKHELHTLFVHLMNYCIDTKINAGRTEYFEALFHIYRFSLKQEIIIEKGVLDPQHYKNIITVGLQIQEFPWVESFIREYTTLLPEAAQENALTYNLAKVYFHQKDYSRVIEQLREVEYQNLGYALGGKLMLLKTYYELGEFLAMDSLMDSFRIYLRRNRQISRDVQQQYLNVLRFVKKLSNLAGQNKKAFEQVRLQIERCPALADKRWILEKLAEIT